MKLTAVELDLLNSLASLPFIDRLEMAAISGWSRGAVYEALASLEQAGLAASVPHATEITPLTRRYRSTGDGLRILAGSLGDPVVDLLRTRPASLQWLRIMADRLDALAVIYRLAAVISNLAYPVRFRLYRGMPLDAALSLPDGRTVGIVRRGQTAGRSAFSKRLWNLHEAPLPGLLLVIVPDVVRLRHTRRVLSGGKINALVALERDAVVDGPVARVWHPTAFNSTIDLRYALDRLAPGGGIPDEDPSKLSSLPGSDFGESRPALPSVLTSAEKRALDVLHDWPWILRGDLAGLLSVSDSRVSQLAARLESLGLVARPRANRGLMALTDAGLALLARRDRTSVGASRRRWSVSSVNAGDSPSWRDVKGGRTRQLLRNIEHTQAVHAFVSALARHSASLGWRLMQVDPPVRASRHFRHGGRMRSINPDAFGVLQRGALESPFFLEWERRAVRPSTMAPRLAPYLRYYSSDRPVADHGVSPLVLMVFDDAIAAGQFLRLAREEIQRTGVEVPLRVSHRTAIRESGPLGRVWRKPQDGEGPRSLLEEPPTQAGGAGFDGSV